MTNPPEWAIPAEEMADLQPDKTYTIEDFAKELDIEVEGFYNFYRLPWDNGKYIKFPCPGLTIHMADSSVAFKAHSSIDDNVMTAFMEACYLGTARLTDIRRLHKITQYRTELVID